MLKDINQLYENAKEMDEEKLSDLINDLMVEYSRKQHEFKEEGEKLNIKDVTENSDGFIRFNDERFKKSIDITQLSYTIKNLIDLKKSKK